MNVLIIGASNKPDRYSYKAFKMLNNKGHHTILMHPTITEIEGNPVYKNLNQITEKIHTITLYVNPNTSSELKDEIIKLKPSRVIFNPGAENNSLAEALSNAAIQVENACTLVLLSTNQF